MSVIFEIITWGAIKRVAAVDEDTAVEVVVQVPAHLSHHDAQQLALRKLKYVLARRKKR